MGLRLSKPVMTHSDWSFGSGFFPCAAQKAFRRKRRSALHTLASVKRLHEDGQLNKAIQAAEELYREECAASTDILYLLLQGCINNKDLTSGRRVHQLITDCGFVKNPFLGSHLIRMFALCGSFEEATYVFEKIPRNTVFTWNAFISACILNGNAVQAINVYQAMLMLDVIPDQHIFVNALKACSKAESLAKGRLIQYQIVVSIFEPNTYVDNTLIDMYVKCHSLEDALSVFERMSSRDVVTWTAIIVGCGEVEHNLKAVRYFQQMQCEGIVANGITYLGIFKACSNAILQDQGTFLHACISDSKVELDLTLGNTLIAMYAKSRRLKDAFEVLNQMPEQDVVTWNVLIAAEVQHGLGQDAFCMYQKLLNQGLEPDEVTFMSILQACSCVGAFDKGRVIHMDVVDHGLEPALFVNNALIGMYGKCGSVKDALSVFRSFPEHDVVTWNTFIAGYIQQKQYFSALEAYNQMQEEGVESDSVTFVSMLQVSSSLTSLVLGMLIHTCINLTGICVDFFLHSCLVEMYNKCESFADACHVVEKWPQKAMMTWNTMFTDSNLGEKNEDLPSDSIHGLLAASGTCFTKLLKACSSLNALDLGRCVHCNVLEVLLKLDAHIGNALIDMYAKCGSIEDAFSVLCKMPKRDAVTWTTLISGCGHYIDYQFASQCYDRMMKEGVAPVEITYVCLLTACSRAGNWKEGCRFFESMINKHALSPTPDHYYCMVDLFGRSGKLTEADDILQTIPLWCPGVVGQRTFISHCRRHRNEELGHQWMAS